MPNKYQKIKKHEFVPISEGKLTTVELPTGKEDHFNEGDEIHLINEDNAHQKVVVKVTHNRWQRYLRNTPGIVSYTDRICFQLIDFFNDRKEDGTWVKTQTGQN